jgi:thioredoxin-dependent peroxiredoxin
MLTSSPGTTQVCLFRDSYTPLTATGFSIYGLSADSPKANTTFKTKQNLPYPLLCDPGFGLIKAIGLTKAPKGTKRGVFVVNKDGKVLAAEPGGPQATVDVVKALIESSPEAKAELDTKKETEESVEPREAKEPTEPKEDKETKEAKESEDKKIADVAGDVADTAEKVDAPDAEKKE